MAPSQLDIFSSKTEKPSPGQASMFEKILAGLNSNQKKAVEHTEGPVLVVAGPGTGKTQIIAARIGNILNTTDALPSNILCLTYTDAGTIAMRKRLAEFIGSTAYNVNIYTFHAFCNDVIQSNLSLFGKWELEPISDLENIQLLYKLVEDLPVDHILKRLKGDIYFEVSRLNILFQMMKKEDWTVSKTIQAIDAYINDLPNREEFIYKRGNSKAGIEKGDVKQHKVDEEKEKMELLRAAVDLFPQYQEMMLKMNRYDYNDMILWVIKAFKENENLLRTYQEQFLYFLVDEYQDTSGSQNELLQLLIDYWESPNVFVVGDDDQSIFEFQGARVQNILDFYKRYQDNIQLITLTDNYRSTQAILDTAKLVIDQNEDRLVAKISELDKTLIAQHPVFKNSKTLPQIIEYHNTAHEEADIVLQIEQLYKSGADLNDVAVIYYKHKQADNIIKLLEKKNIPYKVKKRINILELKLIKQLLQILYYVQAEYELPKKGEPFLFELLHYRFFNLSAHDISKIAIHCGNWRNKSTWTETITDEEELKKIGVQNIPSIIKVSNHLINWVSDMANETLQKLIEKVMNESGILASILSDKNKNFDLQVLKTFFQFAQEESAKNLI